MSKEKLYMKGGKWNKNALNLESKNESVYILYINYWTCWPYKDCQNPCHIWF